MNDHTNGLRINLINQISKLMANTNSHGIETRHRYEEATERFCDFLAVAYHLQKFTNVQSKHFEAYIRKMITDGYSGKTITTDLSGIRFFHELSKSRFTLPSNGELRTSGVIIPPVEVGIVDRAWSDREIERAIVIASAMGRQDVSRGIELCRDFGLRINELASLRVTQLKNSFLSEELLIKGKGGVIRAIPVRTEIQINSLQSALGFAKENDRYRYSDRVLASSEKGGVRYEKERLQNWVSNHRRKFEEQFRIKDSEEFQRQNIFCEEQGFKLRCENISWHGLRHYYAQDRYREMYEEYLGKGLSHIDAALNARKDVSHELGHYRDSITNIYLR